MSGDSAGASATTTLRNGVLGDGRQVDIIVVDGLIDAVTEPSATPPSSGDHDLAGRLVLAPMAEPHAHLDKALTADLVVNPSGDLMGAIDGWNHAAATGVITHDGSVERAADALGKLLLSGCTAVRTHVNVGDGFGLNAIGAVRQAAASYDGLIDVQIVALMVSPLAGVEGARNRTALAAAIEAGVDLIGGCPHLEPAADAMLDVVLDAATDAGLPLDLHVDETLDGSVLTLRSLARKVRERGFELPVAASHCVSLGMQSPEVQVDVAREVAAAGIAVIVLPQTNLFLQARDHQRAKPRGLTAVQALVDASVVVGAGADNVQDPFNLVGRSDPLETAALMVMAGHQSPDRAYMQVSAAARSAMGLMPATVDVGDAADFVAVRAPSLRAAIAEAPASRDVFRGGRRIASTSVDTTIYR